MRYVIGSGPAGVAVASALLDRGFPVTMLDVGEDLPPETARIVRRLSKSPPGRWKQADLAEVSPPGGEANPLKRLYGSAHPYHDDAISQEGVACISSHARGGLSTVWGAAVLPALAEDIDAWPISRERLEPHYAQVLRLLPVTGQHDSLDNLFPMGVLRAFKPSTQAKELLARLRARDTPGMTAGASRLAVDADACVRCARCMYGCPYDLIYSSAHTLAKLMRREGFRYLARHEVVRVTETKDGVRIHARIPSGEVVLDGERVFLAAGAVPTTAILMRSLGIRQTTMIDSQYVVVPAFSIFSGGDVQEEKLHTLAQAFLEIREPTTAGGRTVHVQAYTYNPLFRDTMRARLRFLSPLVPWRMILGRTLILQLFLHSDVSHRIRVVSTREGITLSRIENPQTKAAVRGALRSLGAHLRPVGVFPAGLLAEVTLPGKSFHYGGSFPMRRSPRKPTESDLLGRPKGSKRIHAVDATVFPSIPPTTITLTSMANAYRIGMESP